MVVKTGNTYIAETVGDSIEIPKGKSGVYDYRELEESVLFSP